MADTTLDSTVNTTITSESTVSHGRTSLVQPHDNPFTADGELSNKADYILRHSKISRTEIHIVDPDSPTPVVVEEEVVEAVSTNQQHSAPPPSPPAVEPSESKTNGSDKPASPKEVNVDVVEKEQKPVKQPKKTCKCCSVM
ncbi:hypothetical protein CAPTEDRAFT_196347 [Capitella teleta]|uniref:Uncharacterized protein n=1 Tax=Capitella teleta TaxID=283909 RepID=R7TIN4_CAPTE|nr:hypothetical protein CAPTEDRAFT_196347 [Capitella teleta]|eukprot:ELT90950.1 hypothetical protein CAPTEDRAFT_196347 [Capitella teleta]